MFAPKPWKKTDSGVTPVEESSSSDEHEVLGEEKGQDKAEIEPEEVDEDDDEKSETESEAKKLPGNIKSMISLAIQLKEGVAVGTHKRLGGFKKHKNVFAGLCLVCVSKLIPLPQAKKL